MEDLAMFRRDTYGGYDSGFSRTGNGVSWGLLLVGLGLAFLFLRFLVPTGALPLLFIGGVFTAASFGRGLRGLLIPGGILLGLGTGVIAAAILSHLSGALGGAAVVGGLGAGFWAIHLIEKMRNPYGSGFAWARIPGTILFGIAGFLAFIGVIATGFKVLGLLFNFWWIFLIVGGIWLIAASRRRGANSY
jgi:hypothetical protein